MGIIRNLKGDNDGESTVDKVKKFMMKRLKGFFRPFLLIGILIVILLLFILGVFDLGIELASGENNPKLIYETLGIEDVSELIEIKEDGNGGYYLDFIDGIDDKLREIVNKANKNGDYHKLPTDINFLKRILKAEVYTQFPDLGGTVPSDSVDGFQGAVQIRRVTPNKDPGTMKNTGKGETSSLEQGEVDEPIPVEDRNDRNKLESWTEGQKLKIIPIDANIYESIQGYWQPMLQEGSDTNEIKLHKGDVVTYLGDYTIHNNGLSGVQTVYVKIRTGDNIEGHVKLSCLEADLTGETSALNENLENGQDILVSSRAEAARSTDKIIGNAGDSYKVAIAAGRNSDDDTGIVSDDGTLVEEELTIEVAEKVEELLSEYTNIEVIQTGSTSDDRDGVKPEDRIQLARDADPDLCIQIYFGDGNEAGVETIYKSGDERAGQLAEILSENISSYMGLTNLGSGIDTERCKDSEGNSAALNIIENTAVTGFPSVVAIGGNLNQEPDAGVISSDGIEKYAKGIVYGIDEYFKADHSGLESTEVGETTYKDSIESRILNMKYVPQEQFQDYIDNGDWENAIKSYTLDENRNLLTATWSLKEDGNLELKENSSMNMKTTLEKYMMPYEYLLYFYIDTDYQPFVDDLANEVMNSEIIIAVQDNITTTHTIKTVEQRRDANISRFDTEWAEISQTETLTESVSTKIDLTYVSTWCVKTYQENSYSEAVIELGDEEEKVVDVPGKVTETGPSTSISSETVVVDNAEGRYYYYEEDEDGNRERKEATYHYDILEHTITELHTISNSYEKGDYKTEGRENVFVQLYNQHGMIAKVRTSDYLFSIIENNERTANLLDLTKYLIYKATNVPYRVLEFDFEEYSLQTFSSMSGLYGGTTQEKVWWAVLDAGYSKEAAAGVLGNIQAESGFDPEVIEGGSGIGFGLCQWSYGRRTQLEAYAASKGTNASDENTQIEFLIGEITPGGGADGHASYQLLTYNGYSPDDWKNATTPEDAAIAFCWSFERPGVPRMDVRTEAARNYYEQFKDAERPTGDDRIGQINLSGENATKMMQMLTEAIRIADDDRYTYSQANRDGEFQYDCSSLVARLYKQYFDFDAPATTSEYGSAYYVGADGSVELQPGDVLWKPGHVEMYIGNGLQVGAHTDEIAAADQISVESYVNGYFTSVYRFITE